MLHGAQPQALLGKGLAELEGVLLLVSMLRAAPHLAVAQPDAPPPRYVNTLTLPMRGGLWVRSDAPREAAARQ